MFKCCYPHKGTLSYSEISNTRFLERCKKCIDMNGGIFKHLLEINGILFNSLIFNSII